MKPVFMIKLTTCIGLLMVCTVLYGHVAPEKRSENTAIKTFLGLTNDKVFLDQTSIHYNQEELELSEWKYHKPIFFMTISQYADKAHPNNYFDIISTLEACGTKECLLEAIQVVEEGISDLGELMVFLEKGVTLSLQLKDFDLAQSFQDRILKNAKGKTKHISKEQSQIKTK